MSDKTHDEIEKAYKKMIARKKKEKKEAEATETRYANLPTKNLVKCSKKGHSILMKRLRRFPTEKSLGKFDCLVQCEKCKIYAIINIVIGNPNNKLLLDRTLN